MARYRFLMAMGDLCYAVRHAPELTTERIAGGTVGLARDSWRLPHESS
ncbi:MAG: hypothetical protein M3Z19_10695 [Chloroflexota bacterium]|nr:hypothetical protein [Chloroflexota bacterium]